MLALLLVADLGLQSVAFYYDGARSMEIHEGDDDDPQTPDPDPPTTEPLNPETGVISVNATEGWSLIGGVR